jgi:2-hydroxy-6-oxonona-2,4-dienedioate hydrolase
MEQVATTGTISLGDGKMYYEMAGAGPTLVFTHAGFVDSGMWDAQWEAFTKNYRVIRYDMRGYGKSDPVKAPISRRADLYRLLKHLNVQQATLIGCSLGGEISLDFALEHPELVSRLILVSTVPSGFQMQGEPPPNVLAMMEAAQQGDLERASELQVEIWVDGPFRQSAQVDANVRKRAAEMNRIPVNNQTWAKADMQPLNPLDPPAVGRLKDARVPTLVIAGAKDDPEILRAADVLTNGIPGAKKVVIPETAHVPNMEKPAEFNQAVTKFLKSG